jgi:hypothetical protein
MLRYVIEEVGWLHKFGNNIRISQFRIFNITAVRITNLAFQASKGRLVRNESGVSKDSKSRNPRYLKSSTPLLQCRDKNTTPRALDFSTATLRHLRNYLSSDTAHLLKKLEISAFSVF